MAVLSRFARHITDALGSPVAFLAAVLLMLLWLAWATLVHFNSACQLTLNSVTTVIQFPLFFLLLYVQNKDGKATQVKMDALVHAAEKADDALIGLEDAAEDEIAAARDALKSKTYE